MPFQFENRNDMVFEEPRLLIKLFLAQLDALFENIIERAVEGIDFKDDIRTDEQLIERAYWDMHNRNTFPNAIEHVRVTETHRFEEVGLTGTPLNSKLGLLEFFSDQIRRGVKKAIKYLLELVNSLLDSIKFALGAVGGAVIDFISEFKDMVKTKIDLANDF